ncbi:type VI secretion system Vgr family protein [Paraburkholderia sp. J67]|uniref:type VI secretion system Vgr family protein n=1 Tax=Paraburkholderia sp. J67 TaxID=2805435 RepID=UPI002ABD782F|nr:type VI secretion system tip protein TssI/VgrG [Paraburkholderia sp. J67]
MSWLDQPRTLEIVSTGLPKWRDECLFTVSRLKGTEKLGRLYDYTVEVATRSDPSLSVEEAKALVEVDKLVGTQVTVKIAIEGSGTYETGGAGQSVNIGADVREITGLIVSAECVGADTRRAFYRLRIRPWLFLATLNQDSRIFQDLTVKEISETILKKYPFHYELRLAGPGFGRAYPKRDYQRMFWESDWGYLNRLWQEWGITFFYDGPTLVLCDSTSAYKKHGPAYETLRYLDRDGQRIDEEHVYQFEIARALTTGKVSVTDYDYMQSRANLAAKDSDYRERANDNIEHYAWGDYSQPLAGAMGVYAKPNEVDFEGEHLARVRLEARRAKSLRGKGRGNMRGLRVGHTFHLEEYPLALGNGEYLVTSTKIEIVNNDTVTNRGALQRQYTCETQFTVQPANTYFRTPQKAKKPRSHGEVAVVTVYSDSKIWTDKYGRVKVWFPWDREGKQDQDSSCWVRVSSPWQGANYGAIYIPRAGHEVVIGYHDNDPDKPYIAGRHVNQFHEPPWPLPANQALSGWMSEDLEGPTTNSVVTDDTPGKLQVQVASDHAASRLVLGSNTRIDRRKGRSEARGEGFELATEAHGVVRANRGMLVTTETRSGATQPVKDMGETIARLDEARTLHDNLAGQAQANGAQDSGADQKAVAAAINAQNSALKGKPGAGKFPEFAQPHLTLASPAGIESSTAGSTHVASGEHFAITSGANVSMAAGGSFFGTFGNKLRMTVQKAGMWLVAVSGDIDLRALKDSINLLAKLNVSVTGEKITIRAKQEVEIQGGGSFTRWSAGKIYSGTSGDFEVHSAGRLFTGPVSTTPPTLPLSTPGNQELHFSLGALSNDSAARVAGEPYELYRGNTLIDSGVTDDYGRVVVKDHQPGTRAYCVRLCHGGQYDLNVKDALNPDADHIDQLSSRGVRPA